MKSFQYYFTIIFWSLFITVTLIRFYSQGKEALDKSVITKGKVVGMIPVWKKFSKGRGEYVDMPQIEYKVADSGYLFVDHDTYLNLGDEPTLIYEKSKIRNVKIYKLSHWIDIAFLMPALMISALVYCVVIILSGPGGGKAHKLPGNF